MRGVLRVAAGGGWVDDWPGLGALGRLEADDPASWALAQLWIARGPGDDRRRALVLKIAPRVRVWPDVGWEVDGRWSPCWLWEGPTSGDVGRGADYPRMSWEGLTVAVHRACWQTFFGYLPARKQLDHNCRRRACVNPMHAEPVTQRENCRRRDRARAAESPGAGR